MCVAMLCTRCIHSRHIHIYTISFTSNDPAVSAGNSIRLCTGPQRKATAYMTFIYFINIYVVVKPHLHTHKHINIVAYVSNNWSLEVKE